MVVNAQDILNKQAGLGSLVNKMVRKSDDVVKSVEKIKTPKYAPPTKRQRILDEHSNTPVRISDKGGKVRGPHPYGHKATRARGGENAVTERLLDLEAWKAGQKAKKRKRLVRDAVVGTTAAAGYATYKSKKDK